MVQAVKREAPLAEGPSSERLDLGHVLPAPSMSDAALGQSPVHRMQQEIELAFAPAPRKWSARRTLAFVLITNGLFWAGLVMTVRAVG